MARAIKRHRYPRHVCYLGRAEQSYTATHEPTGPVVKVRPDLLIDSPQKRRRTLVDFKTTRCQDLAQFLETVDKYGYDRRAALYADALSAHRVALIAVQKRAPKSQQPQVWVHELTPLQLQTGAKSTASCCAPRPRPPRAMRGANSRNPGRNPGRLGYFFHRFLERTRD